MDVRIAIDMDGNAWRGMIVNALEMKASLW
jgi:hypothetical protein